MRGGLEAAGFVILEDGGHHVLGLVDDLHQVQVVGADHALLHQAFPEPLDQAVPERLVHQDDGNLAGFAGLHQGQGFHQLVQGAEAPGHHHVGGGEPDEHHLAGEEVAEGLADVLIGIGVLFVGQLDVEADAGGLAEVGTLVGGFHDAGAAAGNHRKAGVGQQAGGLFGERVIGMVGRGAGAAENGYRRADGGQPFGGLDEF